MRPHTVSIPLAEFSPYALTSNEEIDLLKGVIEFDDIVHMRKNWFVIYEHTFYKGGRPAYPTIEYNLGIPVCPNNKEPAAPEYFFRMYYHVENNAVTVGGKEGRILPAFSTISADIESQLKAMKYVTIFSLKSDSHHI